MKGGSGANLKGLPLGARGPTPFANTLPRKRTGQSGDKDLAFYRGTGVKELSARLRHPSFRPIAGVGSCRETVSPDGLTVALSTHRA